MAVHPYILKQYISEWFIHFPYACINKYDPQVATLGSNKFIPYK